MAINTNASRATKKIRCKYYRGEYLENKSELRKDAQVKGVFYAEQTTGFAKVKKTTGNVRSNQTMVKLTTNDFVDDLLVDDFVLFDNEIWLVVSIIQTLANKSSGFLRKSQTVTEIELRK